MTDQALQTLGEAALASNQPGDAVAALNAYSETLDRPSLLFLRAEAHEQAGEKDLAAADYQAVYIRFAISEQAREASLKIDLPRRARPARKFPRFPSISASTHAAMLFNAKDWGDARTEYAELLPLLTGAEHERAQLRIVECGFVAWRRRRRSLRRCRPAIPKSTRNASTRWRSTTARSRKTPRWLRLLKAPCCARHRAAGRNRR